MEVYNKEIKTLVGETATAISEEGWKDGSNKVVELLN